MTNPNRFKIPSLYKKLMLLIIVIGPIYWLMFTEDGQRRTDLVVLNLAGNPGVELRLDILASAASEEQIRKFLPDVEWQCRNDATPFGERTCVSPISGFNDTPAHYMTLYFEQDALQAMKVVYRRAYHKWLGSQLGHILGGPPTIESGVAQWNTGKGLVLMQEQLSETREEPTLMWLSTKRARNRAQNAQSR